MTDRAWHHEPPAWGASGDTITMTAGPRTDFWRLTHDGGVRDNGHFFGQAVAGDFVAEVTLRGEYAAPYDHAGLMLRVDEAHWLKCGIELVEGIQHASVVVTREHSDWSLVRLPHPPPAICLRLTRRGTTVEVHCSLDGADFAMLRQAHLPLPTTVRVGPMAASPEGPGFPVAFQGFAVRPG